MRFCFTIVCAAILLAGVGCSSGRARVSGKVTLNGKALPNATVVFYPMSDSRTPGPGSSAKTDANGEYSLQPMAGGGSGAVVGKHKVCITAYEGGDEPPSSAPDAVYRKPLVPAKYNDPAKTQLTCEVPAGGTASANFELKSK
jgi:hypothetical protein